jgi:indole-3-glycerol phosphate synthase
MDRRPNTPRSNGSRTLTEAQADVQWVPPRGPLGELTARSRLRARESALGRAELEAIVSGSPAPPPFAAALRQPTVAVIAELKRSSPSKGELDTALNAAARAAAYASGGAAALSILTEPSRFGGSLGDLRDARAAVTVPLLRKDFITDEVQVLEARAFGASAVLLIARALAPAELDRLAVAAIALGLTPLIEVRDERELDRGLRVPEAVIGVNNRDLETLVIEPAVGARLIPQVPAERIAVYESGVTDVEGVRRAAALGADAVLVGSVLSTSTDGAQAVRALAAVPRRARG